jgi:DNA-binding transcriptional LysR family regulator
MPENATVLLNRLLARGKFRHVQVLLKLAELGSVQRAADAIGVTQSSVTQTLAYLEDLLGTPLFQRHARGVRPTAAGAELVPVARRLLAGLADAADSIAARHRRGGGVVRLLASAAATNGLLIGALPAFHARHPAIEVHLREAEGEDQLLAIARGEVDLVACRRPTVVPQEWEFHALAEDRFVVVCAADHPLRAKRRLDWPALAECTWLAAPAGTAARERFDEISSRLAQPLRTSALITRVFALMVALIQRSELVSLLPLSFVQHLVDRGELGLLKVGDPMPMEPIGLLQPQGEMREAAARLSSFLRQERNATRPLRARRAA